MKTIFSYEFFDSHEEFEKWQLNNTRIAGIVSIAPMVGGIDFTGDPDKGEPFQGTGRSRVFVVYRKEVTVE